jgi:hypothetical protein
MRQVMEAMTSDGRHFTKEMNRGERRAYQELFNACEDFLTLAEELENMNDNDEDDTL